ncbi:hypothetical protein ACFYPX_19650 [Micromonospora zamorensis]|uniref:hypothetical protein n=1 Tax=Micromonospora zamorensis TaxID=709883 RepID=UPI003687B9C3
MTSTVQSDPAESAVVGRLSRLDQFLPAWIGLAMVAGLLLGRLIPGLDSALDAVTIGGISLPVAIGTFGVASGQALAGVVGPLIEVPVLVGLVYVSLWARRRFFTPAPTATV